MSKANKRKYTNKQRNGFVRTMAACAKEMGIDIKNQKPPTLKKFYEWKKQNGIGLKVHMSDGEYFTICKRTIHDNLQYSKIKDKITCKDCIAYIEKA